MAKVALKYRSAIDDITANKSLKLRKFELDDDDWKIIGDLLRVLKIYKDATLFFSQDQVSTIAAIPTSTKYRRFVSSIIMIMFPQMNPPLASPLTRTPKRHQQRRQHPMTARRTQGKPNDGRERNN